MNKTEALAQLEKFFYQGLEHKGVQLPAAINFAHYTHNIAVGDMLSTNPEREASCALFCKSIFTKPLVFGGSIPQS
jgi:hypothetical protein